ncbi:uncharacterized protein LOC143449492 isoform X2 [Clavelina lepadiformis]|uniref:uncharacterized protein LOC143449492 isoform X1 n=1 Tax=Clavelina lepadiformis TaxID=159417 RepID=UPI0040429180
MLAKTTGPRRSAARCWAEVARTELPYCHLFVSVAEGLSFYHLGNVSLFSSLAWSSLDFPVSRTHREKIDETSPNFQKTDSSGNFGLRETTFFSETYRLCVS